MRVQFTGWAVAILISTSAFGESICNAQPQPAAAVRQSLDRLDAWLGNGPNGRLWRAYLQTDQVRSQLASGRATKPEILAASLGRFASRAPGLGQDEFVTARHAIESWLSQLSPSAPADLPRTIAAAGGRFKPGSPAERWQARQMALAAFDRLDRFLSTGGERGAAWKRFLRWSDLQNALRSSAPDEQIIREAVRRLRSGQVGLELPQFAELADALEFYATANQATDPSSARTAYEAALQSLEQNLQPAAKWTDEQSAAVGRALNQIESLGQVPDLVSAVRRHYSHPNLLFQISDDLLAVGIARPVQDVTPIREVILGTNIRGTGHTVGNVGVRLAPSADRATIETVFTGTTWSRTTGVNGPATIYTNGTTQLYGTKPLFLDDEGLTGGPAVTTADTRTQLRGLSVRGGHLIRKIAQKRVAEGKPQGERIGSQRAARRLKSRLDNEAGTRLAESNRDFLNRFRAPLLRRGQFPELFQFSSTPDYLRLTALNASRNQVGSPSAPPALSGEHQLAVRLHESTVNNLAAVNLSGRTFTGDQLRELAVDLFGKVPERLEDEDPRPWSITFAEERPVTLDVDDQGAKVMIRGSEYTSNYEPYSALNISVHYKFEPTGKGLRAVRQGDIEIYPPGYMPGGAQRLPNRLIAIRRVIRRKLERVFQSEIVREGLVLPGPWEKAGTLPLTQFVADDGWLVLAWR